MGQSIPTELIQKAAHTNLVDYCNTHGIELVKSGDEYLMKEHDSFNISAKEPWKWYWFSQGVGGKAVDFIMYWYGVSLAEAVEALIEVPKSEYKVPLPSEIKGRIIVPNQKCVIAYLCGTRHIDYDIVRTFIQKGKLMEDTFGTCVFPIIDEHGNIISAELHGTRTGPGKKRFEQTVSETFKYGFEYQIGKPVKWVLYLESAIDMMSMYQLHKNDICSTLMVSFAGLKPSLVDHYKTMYPDAKHCLCVDADKRGKEFVSKLGMAYRFPDGGYKDWNDLLVAIYQKEYFART